MAWARLVVVCLFVWLAAPLAAGLGRAQAQDPAQDQAQDATQDPAKGSAKDTAKAATAGNGGVHAAAAPVSRACMSNSMAPFEAENALNEKDYAKAERLFRDVLAESPLSKEIHEGLVRTLVAEDKVEDARKEADAWAAAEPDNAMAMVAAGDAKLRQGDPRGALVEFSRAQHTDPCNPRALYGLAEVYSMAGFHATAQRNIEQAYALHPTDDDIHTWWISTHPHKERLSLLADYAQNSSEINDGDRAALKTRLSKEAQYHASDCRMAPTSPRETKVQMAPLMDYQFNGWGLAVQFNGKRRQLRIDTGASGITISRAAALFLGIKREDEIKVGGIGDKGDVRTSIAHVASVKIGGVEFLNCPVEILEKWDILESDGLIGSDVFDESQVTLDFPRHELRLAPLPARPGETEPQANTPGDDEVVQAHDPYVAPEMAQWLRIYRSGHMLLMPTAIVETKQMKDLNAWKNEVFLLDTGSDLNLITPRAAREVTKIYRDLFGQLGGLSGEVNQVYTAGSFTLLFAGLRMDSQSMTSIDMTKMSHDAGTEMSGIIGAPTLFRMVMHIDYRDNLVKFEYDPKKTEASCLDLGGSLLCR